MKKSNLLYLRPDIQVEPLVDQWYAWPNLIPPAGFARNITERHLPIMESYVESPEDHAAAVKDPKMLGGPFIDYDRERVQEIRELMEVTKRKRAHLIALSLAFEELNKILRPQTGCSLEPLYAQIPTLLRGYTELFYNLQNQASFRLIEPLLYKSSFYEKNAQSLMLSVTRDDSRPFVLSTPRLSSPVSVHIPVPFEHDLVDDLFRMKVHPRALSSIDFDVPKLGDQSVKYQEFFTDEAPPKYKRYEGKGVRWRYFGHACILIETSLSSVLIDPVLSYSYESNISRYTYQDLPDVIDFVLITHNHQDHILLETLLQIRHKVKHIVVPRSGGGALQDPSLKLLLQEIGFSNVVDLGELEKIQTQDLVITSIPFFGEHADLDIRSKLGYLVRSNQSRMLFLADSCNIEPMLYKHLSRDIGVVDALFIGMECDGAPASWLYGPLMTQKLDRAADRGRRLAGCNFEQALGIVRQFDFKEVYVYAMGQEPWLNYIMNVRYTSQSRPIQESDRLIEHCRSRGIVAERLFGEKEILRDG